jgi:KaiC/GvpD/RAD55 family RecA-like ATPase
MEKIITRKDELKRTPLHIQGLDENIEGGIPDGYITLMCGTAGTMKSSVCFNSLYNEAVKEGKIALYVSLEQSYVSILNHVINMGYDLSKVNILLINDLSNINSQLAQLKNSKKGTIIFGDLGCIRKEIKDTKISTTGVLDIIGGCIFLLPFLGFLSPGWQDLETHNVQLMLAEDKK